MVNIFIRPLTSMDRGWVVSQIFKEWGAEVVIAHNQIFYPIDLPGFAAFIADESAGLVTYHVNRNECEIVTLNSWIKRQGVGTELIGAVRNTAFQNGCRRLFVVTTNDNTRAIRFYQKLGFSISAVRINAIAESRKLKPQIPLVGNDDIPIRDEIELEMKI